MKKYFNISGYCVSNENYMVDISFKVAQVVKMLEQGKYFTMLNAICNRLKKIITS